MAEQGCDRCLASQHCRFDSILGDAGEVDVRDEVVGIRTLEHDDLQGVVDQDTLEKPPLERIAEELAAFAARSRV
jgi:hypothetical protein